MVAIREFETQPADLFGEIMFSLKRRLSLFVWQGFLEPLSFVSLEQDIMTIGAPGAFHRDWIITHYTSSLQEIAAQIQGYPLKIRVISVEGDYTRKPERTWPAEPVIPIIRSSSITPLKAPRQTPLESTQGTVILESAQFNLTHTFETFVPGPSNQMGFTACQAVAEQPGSQYSPLFLFGPAGLGKTHLLQAIGLRALSRNPKIKILYMSAEQWVNAYILAIREKRFDAFRKKFRTDCDILLIDDIQFLAGKDASQDEFFHTFNSLHQAHKQIVVTSDKYPHEIEGLENRLQTRLSWGLIADIRAPEKETRISILKKKAEGCKINLPEDVADYLASEVGSSVRELEGALLRFSASHSVSKKPVTLASTKEYLSPVLRHGATQPSADKICEYVALHYDIKPLELKGPNRQRQVALARQISMFFCRYILKLSFPEIGRHFGGRDHSTVISSIRKVEKMREQDLGFKSTFAPLESLLAQA